MDYLGPQAALIERGMDLATMRHRVIASNLANVDTPGYKAKVVDFDKHLQQALIKDREGIAPRQDGNTVMLELEHSDMRKNALIYKVFIVAHSHSTKLMKAAIQGR